ncbi:MAG: UDP-N-acetylglucosamine 2-epimerase (hydrolyzing) [Candidatus Omnitrophica bacterium]|nr:UDP-N-acetylglucosamine 2-epimerase (hydrolyzing) [Candidatus Omnitrophota bacterium]
MKRILAFTSIRSDYDLMSKVYALLHADRQIEFALIVSGTHLSRMHSYTIREIEKDGFKILARIKTLTGDSNSLESRIKSGSVLLSKSIEVMSKYKPDLVLISGDREDMVMAALCAGYLEIPCVHFFGGDHTSDGYIDNPVRHAISKLVTAHVVSIHEHKMRLLSMGEFPRRIFVTGSIALDRFRSMQYLSKNELLKKLNIRNRFKDFALVIFHPFSQESDKTRNYFENILKVLKENQINSFVSYPNTDPGNKDIVDAIKSFKNDENFFFYKNMDRRIFMSIYKYSLFIIGNSSSGILEAASVPIPAINVGLRQKGRLSGRNVVFVDGNIVSIRKAVKKVLGKGFLSKIQGMKNVYGDGDSSYRAYCILKGYNFKKMLFKKEDPLRGNENAKDFGRFCSSR